MINTQCINYEGREDMEIKDKMKELQESTMT